VPFFFSPWRIVVVEVSEGRADKLTPLEQNILREYLLSPPSKTVLVVVLSGKIKKFHSLVKFFSSLPSGSVFLRNLRPLKEAGLLTWIDKKLEGLSKLATPEAKRRLVEIVGNDLQRVDNELEKIVTFVGERKVIDLDDVNQVCDWVKTFVAWELADCLEKADFEQTLIVLNRLFKEGIGPEYILGVMANFFRDLLLAKLRLRENRDKKEIFAELKPRIDAKFRKLYEIKFKEVFALLDEFSDGDLGDTIKELRQIDALIKTSDVSPQVLLETFVFDYCARRGRQTRRRGPIWAGRG
jgi:DNA polymerase-3 subunit delta